MTAVIKIQSLLPQFLGHFLQEAERIFVVVAIVTNLISIIQFSSFIRALTST
jgi:hypothetical protein